ncbi:MAG: hypothetical protein K9L59_10750 [Desulfobacterales bacterium]|nr:hypothetical protein [Desulfobacterales bacterium]
MKRGSMAIVMTAALFCFWAGDAAAWFDETHLAVAKAAGYRKWYNAAGADLAKLKAGRREGYNHYSNHRPGERVTAAEVRRQISLYDSNHSDGHLYGAIVASLRNAVAQAESGGYGHDHLAYCVHYIGDLSMPQHHLVYNAFNQKTHQQNDGIINQEVLDNLHRIRRYPIRIDSESDLVGEIVRIANLSLALGWKLEEEDRLMTPEEAYRQLGHSASLLHGVLAYLEEKTGR